MLKRECLLCKDSFRVVSTARCANLGDKKIDQVCSGCSFVIQNSKYCLYDFCKKCRKDCEEKLRIGDKPKSYE